MTEFVFDVPDGQILGAVIIGNDTWAITAEADVPGVEKLLREMLLQAVFPEVQAERTASTERLLNGIHRRPYLKRKTT